MTPKGHERKTVRTKAEHHETVWTLLTLFVNVMIK